MESLPELENLTATQDRPKSKWKRPVIWCSLVILLLANLYYVAITWLPRWAPAFAAEYVPHPTAMARAVATQIEKTGHYGAWSLENRFHSVWFTLRDADRDPTFNPWAQGCFRDFFIRGGKWERLAIISICQEFSCPDCFDLIAAEIPNLDHEAKLMAIGAIGRMKTSGVLPELEKYLSDPDVEVRRKTVWSLLVVGYSLTETHDKARALDLLRRAVKGDTEESVKELAAYFLVGLRSYYWKNSSPVAPDEELLSLLRSPYESVRVDTAGTLVHEQYHGRLDAAWYPLLNEVFEKDISKETRGNAALILILADDPQSAEKLKFIESLCDPKYAPLPLDRAKIYKGLSDYLPYGLSLSYVLQRWNPSWKPGFRRTPIGG